jgi:hypothetical protein
MASMMATLDEGFTEASLRGRYSVRRIGYGGQTESAAVGVYDFDGRGNWTGVIVANIPGPVFGRRAQVRGEMAGTYALDASGSGFGTTSATVILDSGASNAFAANFLITRACRDEQGLLAEEISIMEDAADPVTGSIHMVDAIRQPDAGTFSPASFQGTYGGPGISRGGRTPASAIGIGCVHFDGHGGFTAVDLQNLSGPLFTERRTVSFDTENGRYTVNPDGTGMIVAPGGQAHIVISRARVEGDVRVCLEYVFVTNDAHPPTGNLVTTSVSKRLP